MWLLLLHLLGICGPQVESGSRPQWWAGRVGSRALQGEGWQKAPVPAPRPMSWQWPPPAPREAARMHGQLAAAPPWAGLPGHPSYSHQLTSLQTTTSPLFPLSHSSILRCPDRYPAESETCTVNIFQMNAEFLKMLFHSYKFSFFKLKFFSIVLMSWRTHSKSITQSKLTKPTSLAF